MLLAIALTLRRRILGVPLALELLSSSSLALPLFNFPLLPRVFLLAEVPSRECSGALTNDAFPQQALHGKLLSSPFCAPKIACLIDLFTWRHGSGAPQRKVLLYRCALQGGCALL